MNQQTSETPGPSACMKMVPRQSRIHSLVLKTYRDVCLGMNPLKELGIAYRNHEDYEQLKTIARDILRYPVSDLAQFHRDCNRLGNLDVEKGSQQSYDNLFAQNEPEIVCQCCGFLLQLEPVPVATDIDKIKNMGLSTHLFFQTLFNLSLLVGLQFLVYGIYSLVTNISASQSAQGSSSIPYILYLSSSAKETSSTDTNEYFLQVQNWLSLAVVVVWFAVFALLKYRELNNEIVIEKKTISASDFTVVMEGVPANMTKQDLQQQLNKYYESLPKDKVPVEIDKPPLIAKYDVSLPFYLTMQELIDEELKALLSEQQALRFKFIDWLIERQKSLEFSTNEQVRSAQISRYFELQTLIHQKYDQNRNRVIEEMKSKLEEHPKTTVFVTFQSSHARELFVYLNTPKDLLTRFKNFFSCLKGDKYFFIEFQGKRHKTTIQQAPEPESIIWTNMGQTFTTLLLRKLMTYLVSCLLLGASFACCYFLSELQIANSEDTLISFSISFSISVINLLIPSVVRYLTTLEREDTQTQFQTGLALKSIVAQLLNSVIMPFVIKYFLQADLYSSDGLCYSCFTLSITTCFLPPLLKLLNLQHIFSRVKCWFFSQPSRKLYIRQQDFNRLYELQEFETGNEYIYPANVYLFVCFYCALQPIICMFGVCGICLMYWVQKYSLFNRSKRPYPGDDMVNTAMSQVIYFGPLVFSLGNVLWHRLGLLNNTEATLVPHYISIAFSALFALLPYQFIFSRAIKQAFPEEMLYSKNRVFLPSQYDRLNPATSRQAMKEYCQLLKEFKLEMKQKSKDEVAMMRSALQKQKQKGSVRNVSILDIMTSLTEDEVDREAWDMPNMEQEINKPAETQQMPTKVKFNVKRPKKSLITPSKLFKRFVTNQQNSIKMVPNWSQKEAQQICQDSQLSGIAVINCEKTGALEHEPVQKPQSQPMTYKLIKKIFSKESFPTQEMQSGQQLIVVPMHVKIATNN